MRLCVSSRTGRRCRPMCRRDPRADATVPGQGSPQADCRHRSGALRARSSDRCSRLPVPVRSSRIAWLVAALATIALIATAVVALRMSRTGTPAPDPVQFTIAPPENTVFRGPAAGGTGTIAQLAVSPDGRNIAFVAGAQSEFQLWLRPVASADARAIAGNRGRRVSLLVAMTAGSSLSSQGAS